ncbi:hypothetical protein K439DRAFT_1624264 [Ramaria rubella]|nr:hypothetical protein K439DRAFT_1624264 [Ramaria rubella]
MASLTTSSLASSSCATPTLSSPAIPSSAPTTNHPPLSTVELLCKMPMELCSPKQHKSMGQWLWEIRVGTLNIGTSPVIEAPVDSQLVVTLNANDAKTVESPVRHPSLVLSIPDPNHPNSLEFWGREIPPPPPK